MGLNAAPNSAARRKKVCPLPAMRVIDCVINKNTKNDNRETIYV